MDVHFEFQFQLGNHTPPIVMLEDPVIQSHAWCLGLRGRGLMWRCTNSLHS